MAEIDHAEARSSTEIIQRLKPWRSSDLIDWAVGPLAGGKHDLCRSAVPAITDLSQIPGGPYHVHVAGNNLRGHGGLKDTIANLYDASPDNVLLAQGAAECNFLLAGAILRNGGTAIVETPTFGPTANAVEHFAERMIRLPRRHENGFLPDLDELSSLIDDRTRLICLTDLHNPSGVRLDDSFIQQVVVAASEVGAAVIVDEVFKPMLSWDYRSHAWSIGAISVGGMDKAYGLGDLRVGWAVAPEEIVREAYSLNDMVGIVQPYCTEDIAYQILSDGANRPFFMDRAAAAQEGRAIFEEFGDTTPGVICWMPSAGINAVIKLPETIADEDFAKRLRNKRQTSVFPGMLFGLPGWLRVSFGGDSTMVREGLHRIGEMIEAW